MSTHKFTLITPSHLTHNSSLKQPPEGNKSSITPWLHLECFALASDYALTPHIAL